MIPAESNCMADFENSDGKATATRPIVAWDRDGHPLIVGERGLTRAETVAAEEGLGGFRRVRTYDLPPVVAAIPGGGWMVEVERADGSLNVEPVVAWTFTPDGFGEAQVFAGGRDCRAPSGKWRLFHPSEAFIAREDR